MVDLLDAVQAAVFASLSAGVTLAPIYSVAPEGTQPPYIIIADDTVDPTQGAKDGIFEQHDVRIVTVFGGATKRALFAAMNQVRVALADKPLTFTGALLSNPYQLSADDRIDGQNEVLIGEQTFRIFAQPGD